MRVMGAAAACAKPVVDELMSTTWAGLSACFWSDGTDVICVLADIGDRPEDVQKLLPRIIPGLMS